MQRKECHLVCLKPATILFSVLLLLGMPAVVCAEVTPQSLEVDVCIYGATPSGIVAAIAVRREGRSVVIVEPGRWVGGMLGAGLKPLQDCPNFAATGGMTRELLPVLGHGIEGHELAGRDAASEETGTNGDSAMKAGAPRTFGPDAIREDFQRLLDVHGIRVVREHRVAACDMRERSIVAATFDLAPFDELGCPVPEPAVREDLRVVARIFVDASYEGDLMARAGVGYRVGREAEAEFGESHAGVQPPMELTPIDPFVQPGRPESGLLKWVENDHGKPVGAADGYTQAYNYRYYTTLDPDQRIAITPPAHYDPQDYELVGRYVTHLVDHARDPQRLHEQLIGIFPGWMNSGEWNYQRDSLFSMAPLGISHLYADGDYTTKARVWKEHQDYLRGLHHFMSTDDRVPKSYRDEVAQLGLDGRFHAETGGWPHQLYIRVARRLRGRYTITAHDVYNETQVDDPIGLAQYGIDTYPARRIWIKRDGELLVGIEGKMFIGGNRGPTNVPYPIPYRAITPGAEECSNLLVPVCFSATHLGYASARMEPVFMICGESAGIAACRALAEGSSVQAIDMVAFRHDLEARGQKLTWDPVLDRAVGPPSRSKPRVYSFELLLAQCDRDADSLVSRAEWTAGKTGWEWLFANIDSDQSGMIDKREYATFQQYKAEHPDWQTRLRTRDD